MSTVYRPHLDHAHASARRAGSPRVVVCVATYRRPLMLRALMESLGALEFPEDATPDVRVVVVDNDAAASGKKVVDAACDACPWPLTYLVEPHRNIARARNRGVAEALRVGADFVSFVDDDEVVHPQWLHELVTVQDRYQADVVCGNVLRLLPDANLEWLCVAGPFKPLRYRTGTPLVYANTANVLVNAQLLAAGGGEPFDPDFGISGGSDALFFAGWQRRGARMVWAADAVVEERIPPSRARIAWLLQRGFRIGNASVFCERALPREQRRLTGRVLNGTARLTVGLVALLPSLLAGRGWVVRALWQVAYGSGSLAALAGYRYLEYGRLHGE